MIPSSYREFVEFFFQTWSGVVLLEGGGRGDWDGEYMYIHGWFMSMYDKNHYNIVK